MTKQPGPSENLPTVIRLRNWFAHAPGSLLLEAERIILSQLLPNLFGYHIVQLGRVGADDFMPGTRISHRVTVDIEERVQAPTPGAQERQLHCLAEALPFGADSIDVMVLPHVLEFASDPHQVLRETDRVLIGEGHVVIIGLNPWSLWGIWRVLLAWRDDPPWCGRFLSVTRIKDWLNLLGFDVETTTMVYFRPPLRSQKANRRLAFLEKLGAYIWPIFGAAYIVAGKKRVIPLSPIRMRWHARRRLIASGVAEPSTRV